MDGDATKLPSLTLENKFAFESPTAPVCMHAIATYKTV